MNQEEKDMISIMGTLIVILVIGIALSALIKIYG